MTVVRTSLFVDIFRNARLPAIELAIKILFGIVFAAILYISNRIDLLVSGSDATSLLIAPTPIAQAAEIIVVALCLLAPTNPRWRAALTLPALVFAALATHRVLIDSNHGEVRDLYALASAQSLRFDPVQEGSFNVTTSMMSVALRPAGSAGAVHIITPPVLGLDRSLLALLAH